MRCPHCSIGISWSPDETPLFEYYESEARDPSADLKNSIEQIREAKGWDVAHQECPECEEQIIYLRNGIAVYQSKGRGDSFAGIDDNQPFEEYLVWPRSSARHCPLEVPADLSGDFQEAAAVLSISAKASAALSRRCMQHLLRDYAHTKSRDLAKQIEEVTSSGSISSTLAEQLEAVRQIGNFAAHTQKSTNSGEILDVEPEEAEWNLEVLEELFEHYFVKPAKNAARKAALNIKLLDAGKPTIS